jgi:hypothetical protein
VRVCAYAAGAAAAMMAANTAALVAFDMFSS